MIGPSVNFINNLSISLVMIFGGILYLLSQKKIVTEGQLWFITIGGITQFVMYSRKFAGPINEFANIISEFQSAYTAAERIFRIIDEEPEPLDNQDAIVLENTLGDVELKNVEFGYTEEKMIIHNLSFHAEPGKTIAIVGPTGAGKTTIINLLMRFYDITSGKILVDNQEIMNITRDSLRSSYTMVLQDTWLFMVLFMKILFMEQKMPQWRKLLRLQRLQKFILLLNNYLKGITLYYQMMALIYLKVKNN